MTAEAPIKSIAQRYRDAKKELAAISKDLEIAQAKQELAENNQKIAETKIKLLIAKG